MNHKLTNFPITQRSFSSSSLTKHVYASIMPATDQSRQTTFIKYCGSESEHLNIAEAKANREYDRLVHLDGETHKKQHTTRTDCHRKKEFELKHIVTIDHDHDHIQVLSHVFAWDTCPWTEPCRIVTTLFHFFHWHCCSIPLLSLLSCPRQCSAWAAVVVISLFDSCRR